MLRGDGPQLGVDHLVALPECLEEIKWARAEGPQRLGREVSEPTASRRADLGALCGRPSRFVKLAGTQQFTLFSEWWQPGCGKSSVVRS